MRWGSCLSESFCILNGVWQGSVLSLYLFAVYFDGFVACYWGCHFAGAFCYADDVGLLPPCPSALRPMLNICVSYAASHKLEFNATKYQIICFHVPTVRPSTPLLFLNNTQLLFTNKVVHLGHVLTENLSDTRAVKDLNCRANSVL